MRRRYKILASVAVIALLLLAMWLAFHNHYAQRGLRVGFTSARGHFPEPGQMYAEQITVLWVTNTGRSAVTLDEGYVQEENAAGRRVADHGPSWNQKEYSVVVSAGTSAWLAGGFDGDTKRLRFVFDYHWVGGPLVKGISKGTGVLPLKALPSRTYDWLLRNGLVDGMLRGHYESPWIANPQAGGRKSSHSDTNQISPPG